MSQVAGTGQPAAAPPGVAAFLFGGDAPTVAQALQQAAGALATGGVDTPRLDAEVLLAHALGIGRSALLARLQEPLPQDARATFAGFVGRRRAHEPVAYITGCRAFYGLDFYVDRRVLIPRSETELLIDCAIEITSPQFRIHNSQFTVADVGTGSGCIAVALAVNLTHAAVCAIDYSPAALEVARINVEWHGVGDRVRLVCSDLLHDLEAGLRFDMIVANLPYVSEAEWVQLPPDVRDYEPVEQALAAGPDGLNLIRRLLADAPTRLRPGGSVLLEIGAAQGTAAAELARRHFPEAEVCVRQDLAGLDRVVEIQTWRKR